MSVLIVSGTGTGVGKTAATAALAACASGSVAVVKPVQTGPDVGGPPDIDEVSRLSGRRVVEVFAR
jgi:dethiobiotin synthetase